MVKSKVVVVAPQGWKHTLISRCIICTAVIAAPAAVSAVSLYTDTSCEAARFRNCIFNITTDCTVGSEKLWRQLCKMGQEYRLYGAQYSN
ncbi:hypothetical protein B566_EDAN003682 [Ephemera danica]|nr:hypothetical protein B566_EDAN003682 [Ephemera danica]